jgi:hypothetical protein
MSAENICASLRCPAACCRDIELPLSRAEATRFIEGQEVNYVTPAELQGLTLDQIPSIPQGITIVDDGEPSGITRVYLKGPCPYVDVSTMNCTIYMQKKRPGICSEVPIGHPTCTTQRARIGLPEVKPLVRG